MADPFSYESDIAPLRGNNFGGAISPAYFAQQKFLREGMDVNREASAVKIAEIQQAAQRQQLAFESQRLQLEETTRKIREERDALAVLPDITKRLTEIRENPELDDTQKIIKSAELESEYTTAATRSPEIKNLFGTFNNSIKAKKEDLDRSNNLAYTLIQSGQGEAAKKILEGRTDPMAANFMVAADAVSAAKKRESESKSAATMDKEMRAAQTSLLNRYMETLDKVQPPKDEAVEFGTLKTDGKTPTIPQVKPFKLPEEDKYQIQDMIRSLNDNIDEEKLKSASDEQLYKTALESVTGTLKNLAGFRSQFNRDAFRNKQSPPQ